MAHRYLFILMLGIRGLLMLAFAHEVILHDLLFRYLCVTARERPILQPSSKFSKN